MAKKEGREYEKYELPDGISQGLRDKFQALPPEILPTLERITERDFLSVSHGLGNTPPKIKKDAYALYLADNGNYYRARLEYTDGHDSSEALQQAQGNLIGYVPPAYSPQTKRGTNGNHGKTEKKTDLGRRDGRKPPYLLGNK